VRHLRLYGNPQKLSDRLLEDYDIDDKRHKQAICNLQFDRIELAVVCNYYIDRDTLLELYDKHIGEYK
jgi:hypothetical protein